MWSLNCWISECKCKQNYTCKEIQANDTQSTNNQRLIAIVCSNVLNSMFELIFSSVLLSVDVAGVVNLRDK